MGTLEAKPPRWREVVKEAPRRRQILDLICWLIWHNLLIDELYSVIGRGVKQTHRKYSRVALCTVESRAVGGRMAASLWGGVL